MATGGRFRASVRPKSSRTWFRSACCSEPAKPSMRSAPACLSTSAAFGDGQVEFDHVVAERADPAEPAIAAVCVVAGDAAAERAWQIIRLAIRMAASDDEIRVAATPYGIAVSLALHDLYSHGGAPAHGYQARPACRCRREPEGAARGCAGLAHRARPAQRFQLGQAARLDPRRHLQHPAIRDRQRAGPCPAHSAPARRQGYPGRRPGGQYRRRGSRCR